MTLLTVDYRKKIKPITEWEQASDKDSLKKKTLNTDELSMEYDAGLKSNTPRGTTYLLT